MKKASLLIGLLAVFGLTACGEREQVIQPVSEKRYQGTTPASLAAS